MTDLEMKLYLCMRDFRQKRNKKGEGYGWPIAVYCTPEHLWGYDTVTAGYQEDPEESWNRIVRHMNDIYPIATEGQIRKVLGISKSGSWDGKNVFSRPQCRIESKRRLKL